MKKIMKFDKFSVSEAKLDGAALATLSNDKKKIEAVAREFSRLLLAEIGNKKFREVVKRNKLEKDKGICHSHDFCDANMVMQDAFKIIGMNLERDYPDMLQNQVIVKMWNAAWDMAKKNDMYMHIRSTEAFPYVRTD